MEHWGTQNKLIFQEQRPAPLNGTSPPSFLVETLCFSCYCHVMILKQVPITHSKFGQINREKSCSAVNIVGAFQDFFNSWMLYVVISIVNKLQGSQKAKIAKKDSHDQPTNTKPSCINNRHFLSICTQ